MKANRGYCQHPDCDYPKEIGTLTYIRYTPGMPHGGYICDGCLEACQDAQEFLDANRGDMAEIGENTGEVLIM